MKITPLPSAEKVVEIICEYQQGRAALHCEMRDRVTQDRNQAYTSLIEGIEAMITEEPLYVGETQYRYNKGDIRFVSNIALSEIIEKVVKPLYGKK